MLMFQGIGRVNGALKVIALPVGTAPPAGTSIFNGLAIDSSGYLYVVIV